MRPPFLLDTDTVTPWEKAHRVARSRYDAGDPATADPGGFAAWLAQQPEAVPPPVRPVLDRFWRCTPPCAMTRHASAPTK